MTDLVLVHPGAAHAIYQDLADEFTAVEPPMWARAIANFIRNAGYSVLIVDAEAERLTPEAAAARVDALNPRFVAVVCFGHQPSASTQQMTGARAFLKAYGHSVHTILLGGHVSALPERTLNEEPVHYACKGEGPLTLLGLLRRDYLPTIPGLAWRDAAGMPVINPPADLLDVSQLERDGQSWDLLPVPAYRAHNWHAFGSEYGRQPYASIYTSLGCPYKCSFCCINAPFDSNRYRMRDPRKVVLEIHELMFYHGVHTIKIVDEMFVLNDRHVNAICDLIIEGKLGDYLNIWAYARVDTVKPAMLSKLRAAGIRWLALGIESGSKHVRDGATKALKHDDIIGTVRAIQAAGINVIGNYIFGLPDDTHESMMETLDLATELNCEFANFYSAMAYPGSGLFNSATASDLPAKWSGYSQHSFDCTPLPTDHLSAREVLTFRDTAFSSYFNNARYQSMVDAKFGEATAEHVRRMAGRAPLTRALLQDA